MIRRLMALALVAVVLVLAPTAHAAPGDEYTVSVLTMAPGDEVFFKFGHNALWVHDSLRRRDFVYNWGMFSFDEDGLIAKFLQGKLTYWLAVFDLRSTIAEYTHEQRAVQAQELDLTNAEKLEIVNLANENAKKENRAYKYDYYLDNCSTRVRDLIDRATHGALHAVSNGPAPMTYRGETSRLTADLLWAYIALNVAMGSYIDQPVTEWDEMFAPFKLQEMLRKVNTPRGPLVKGEKMLVTDSRPPLLAGPPHRFVPMLVAGCAIGALFFVLAIRAIRQLREGTGRGARVSFALPLGLFCFLTSFLGVMFVFLWCCTDHRVAWHNENLFIVSPASGVMLAVAYGFLRRRPWTAKLFERTALFLAASAILGALVKAIPAFRQVNAEMLALFVPIWIGLALGAWRGNRAPAAVASPELLAPDARPA